MRSDGGQHPRSPRHFSRAEAKASGLLEGPYPRAPGRFGGNGLLHDGGLNAQKTAYVDNTVNTLFSILLFLEILQSRPIVCRLYAKALAMSPLATGFDTHGESCVPPKVPASIAA